MKKEINPDNGHGAADGIDAIFDDFVYGNASRSVQAFRGRRDRVKLSDAIRATRCDRHIFSSAGQCLACGVHRE